MLPDNIEDAFALSPIQVGMLYDSLLTPESDVYVTYVTVDIRGVIEGDLLRQSWVEVFKRHQSLRAQFHWIGLDEPLQVIVSDVNLDWQYQEWPPATAEQHSEALSSLIREERSTTFDLSKALLSRFKLIKTHEDRWTLLWTVHHLVADGLSTPTILEDVQRVYAELLNKDAYSHKALFQYSDYLAWLGAQDHTGAEHYWKSYLKGAVPTPVKICHFDSEQSEGALGDLEIAQVKQALSAQQTRDINAFCQNHRITLSTFMHGLWALLLSAYCDHKTPLFASTVSGRHAEVDGMEEAVGLYLNAQPRLIGVNSDLSLVDWLSSIQVDIHESSQYDYSSLSEVQSFIAKQPNEKAFDSIITIGGHPSELDLADEGQPFVFTNIRYQSTQSHYALAFLVFPGQCLEYSLVYDRDVYSPVDINNLSAHVSGLMSSMMENAETTAATVSHEVLLKTAGRYAGNSTANHDYSHSSIHHWFEQTVDRHPQNVAISCGSSNITFQALDDRANQIARMLADSTGYTSNIVGLLLPRGADMVAALLGILKAGCTYVPLDPSYPKEKLDEWIESADIRFLVTNSESAGTVQQSGVTRLNVENAANYGKERLVAGQVHAAELAYIMFTSGSTGRSKGVMISHDNLVYSTAARIAHYKKSDPVFLLLSSIAFDSSVAGLYWALCGGGRLVLPQPDQEKDLATTLGLIESNAVTHTLCLPSYYELLLQHADSQALSQLDVVIVAGEVCHPRVVRQHFSQNDASLLFNEYGPTEACVWSTVHQVNHSNAKIVPIGKAIGTTFIQVFNSLGVPCPAGVEGEIYIGGTGVSPGYYKAEQLTDDHFFNDSQLCNRATRLYKTGDTGYFNDTDELVYTGRIDRQLKIRGYRIEPGEIETVLEAHSDIEKAVVVAVSQSAIAQAGQTEMDLIDAGRQRLAVLAPIPESAIEDALKKIEAESMARSLANDSLEG